MLSPTLMGTLVALILSRHTNLEVACLVIVPMALVRFCYLEQKRRALRTNPRAHSLD